MGSGGTVPGPAEDPGLVSGQFRFFDAHVLRARRLGPTLTRITFGGEQLAGLASGGRDQSFSLFLPHPGQQAPLLPDRTGAGWYGAWRALPEEERAVLRSYTVRDRRRGPDEVDVDFALHGIDPDGPAASAGQSGPASRWAAGAAPGDRVVLLGPAVADNRSVGFRPPADTDWVLLAADETALPALGGILDWLPAGTAVRAWIEVPHPHDILDLPSRAEVAITWLVREPGAAGSPLAGAVRTADLPAGTPYVWLAGESATVRGLRRHLVGERGVDRRRVEFSGYWRRGASEEQLRAEKLASSSS
ncbi:NADPH-dependent ferric siderophore reductase [Streptomyces tateyamensis]|uniref:NADPH-dependent ferric siderophore reductase n=1 Tax=Streptomyces tateyamensis TaxID=565073 RepID=A0A2V4NQS2_9ACTN|nr:siderophore-interacting protein [Streptomyces tateyamensis]PYC88212.1 NADPH-dependent ferric siderophore reductase [Streptomyces tateyamensis]